ncbi:unnamed protein product [marine sediment metagenome]|uniref:Uncharacterized protein n=1 Tax=marine sediment metagenome TaxID=412755 RepID=X0ZHH7_9ZZZZ
MLDKKATELTKAIFDSLDIFIYESQKATIHAVILNSLKFAYLQGRKYQIDKVNFWNSSSGSLKFRSE